MKKILVSACLMGISCKYSGEDNKCDGVLELNDDNILIPVCPEQLGGLATPREPVEIVGDDFLTKENIDCSIEFRRGALEVLKVANLLNIDYCILKEGSPSCGSNLIYDGTFSGVKIKGLGETTRLLRENGYKVISDEEL